MFECSGVYLYLFSVCASWPLHVGSKWSRARSDEVGMCGHAFNELTTRPQLKERGRKVEVDKEEEREK